VLAFFVYGLDKKFAYRFAYRFFFAATERNERFSSQLDTQAARQWACATAQTGTGLGVQAGERSCVLPEARHAVSIAAPRLRLT
jgi:hypothetical protein